jgi:hypothetical protein
MRRPYLPLALFIMLTAAALRLWQLHVYPPGPHYDESVYLIITRSIAFGGARPFPIVEAYQGREVLYMYLSAPLLQLLGSGIFTLHVANAFYNLLTIAASIALGHAMFSGERGIIVGLTVGVLIALNFPQIWLGRQAFRAVTLPLCQSLALLCLWRGLNARHGDWRWLVAGGILAGAALYTYMASRLFPLWLLVGGVALLVFDSRRRLFRLRQGVLFFGVLALTVAPMVVYAIQRPDIFFGRLSEVTETDKSITLNQSILVHTRMFFIEGEPYLRYNIPGRPYLTWPEGLLMLVGLSVCVWRIAHTGRATERAAYLLALLSPLMVIPSVISVGGLPPNHMRSLGMVPLIFVLVAVGFEAVFSWLARRLRLLAPPRAYRYRNAFASLAVAVLLVGGLLVGETYFAWAGRADLYYESDADMSAAAKWVTAHTDADTLVYVAARDRGHPTFEIEPVPPVTWLGTTTLFRPPTGTSGLYIFPRSAPPPADYLAWLEPGRITDLPLGPDGRTAFEAFRLDGDTPLPPLDSPLGDAPANAMLSLDGIEPMVIAAGGHDQLAMAWSVHQTPPFPDFTPIVQLEDRNENVLDRSDVYITDTDRWRSGEVLFQRVDVRVPFGTPPGHYPVQVAWVGKGSNTYVPYQSGSVWANVGEIEIIRPSDYPDPSALPIQVQVQTDVQPGVRLLGWNPPATSARPGDSLGLSLFWQAVPQSTRAPLTLEAVLRNDAGETVLWTGAPVDNTYSPEQWADGELVTDHERWAIPREQAAGQYALVLRAGDTEIDLGGVEVTALDRVFEAPSVDHVVDIGLGNALRLYGYSIDVLGRENCDLKLVWYANGTTNKDYTVFVHVLNEQGIVIAQQDHAPQQGTYPTFLWQRGEYVSDDYTFSDLPEGEYTINVGLYSQKTGEHLNIENRNTSLPSDTIQLSRVSIDK